MVSLTSSGQVKGNVTVRTYEALVGRATRGYRSRGDLAKPTRVSSVSGSDEGESLAVVLKVIGHGSGLELVARSTTLAIC
jgi:hypothetical protein